MSGFLYFFPGMKSIPDVDEAAALPVASVWEGIGFDSIPLEGNGPSGKSGMVIVPRYPNPPPGGYYPAQQEWIECGSFWLGWPKDAKPGPEHLRRPKAFGEYALELGDGNRWLLPTARVTPEFDGGIPCAMKMDSAGKMVRVPLSRHAKLMEYAATAFAGLRYEIEKEGEPVHVDWDFNTLACVAALNTNYRITAWEISALELLTTQNMAFVLMVLSGYQDYLAKRAEAEAAQKKTESPSASDTSSTTGGPGA